MYRDFTYIEDAVRGLVEVMANAPKANEDGVKYKVCNMGSNRLVSLTDFVSVLEGKLLKCGMIDGVADMTEFEKDFGVMPATSLEQGLDSFVRWYKDYNRK
jgi:UDP-glucuronate 4-epimerase